VRRRVWVIAAVLLGAATAASGQEAADQAAGDKNAASRAQIIDEMLANGVKAATLKGPIPIQRPFETTFGAGGDDSIVAYLIATYAGRSGYRGLLDAMEARVDKQVGAAPSGSASTSLTMKGLVPEVLGAAVETGALTEDVKGTAVTFRATPAGIIKALQGLGIVETYVDYSNEPGFRFASRFSAAATFDTSRGPSANTFTGDARQLTNWSARAVVINGRDPASPEYAKRWRDLLIGGKPYTDAAQAIDNALKDWKEFKTWEDNLTKTVQTSVDEPWAKDHDTSAAAERFVAVLTTEMPKLEHLANPPAAVMDALDKYVLESARLQKSIAKIYDFANQGLLITFDWSTARDATLPDLYTATGVIEAGLGADRKTDLTVNVVANVYRHTPANASQAFKSFEVSMQLEHPLGRSFVLPSASAAVSARYSYLPKDTVAASVGTAGTAASGSIVYVQGKLTVPVKGSGVKVPLSVTASNRTELIKEANVRGSVGLTFDLDTFMTALGLKSK
jgi:hypothetical protein